MSDIIQNTSIYADYIQLTKQYQAKYGDRTIVLLQVGAFFEVYGFRCSTTNAIQESQIVDFSQICNLNVSEKKIVFEMRQVLMAGFRDYTLDKYLQRLCENGYSSVVYVQEKVGKTITRVLDSVHSPGTYISHETDNLPQMTNNIMCVWLDIYKPISQNSKNKTPAFSGFSKTRDTLVCGIAVANIFTGKSYLTEYQHVCQIQPTTFDELERVVAVHCPSEIILISSLDQSQIKSVLQFSGVVTQVVHTVSTETSEKALNCAQQKYIRHILSSFYGAEAADLCIEFQTYPTAVQAFCYLLDFVQEHNPNLVRNISIPIFHNNSTGVLLANHTLKQLNILDDTSQDVGRHGHLSSVCSFLNRCCSAMGKRLFQTQLVSPTTDETWLNREYNMTNKMLEPNNYEMVGAFRKMLGQVRDIEKLCRQLVLRKIYPSSISQMYVSVQTAQQIHVCLAELGDVQDYLNGSGQSDDLSTICYQVMEFLDKNLFMDRCKLCSSMSTFEESIVRPGVCRELDQALAAHDTNTKIFDTIYKYLNELMHNPDNGGSGGSNASIQEFVKIHETEKSGISLQITKKRGLLLKKILQDLGTKILPYTDELIIWKDVKFTSVSVSTDEIEFPLLTQTCRELLYQKETLNKCITIAYEQVLSKLETGFYEILETISKYLAKIDVLQCKAYIAREYNYCCPVISPKTDTSKSFVDARALRHVLIEHLQTNEIYVANDLSLGKEPNIEENGNGDVKKEDGILLYGTNAVGKTSIIRALGISVIMAQSGLFVPCSEFNYRPYSAIFSRILGNDNLFRGLSTFAVEMSELRVILKMADKNSLILGDELCSGTETESALSIFVAGLMDLHEKEASFIFATHFHEIVKYEEIQNLNRLALKHMAVHYDRALDALVYDRKVKPGAGNRMYGLEVCKSLHLDVKFLDKAYSIRAKYFPDSRSELSHTLSVYNAKKIRGLCEMCQSELGTETHHINQQKDADEDGFIETTDSTFHINHPANLMTVCEGCHLKFHATKETELEKTGTIAHISGGLRKKTTKGYGN